MATKTTTTLTARLVPIPTDPATSRCWTEDEDGNRHAHRCSRVMAWAYYDADGDAWYTSGVAHATANGGGIQIGGRARPTCTDTGRASSARTTAVRTTTSAPNRLRFAPLD